MKYKDITETLIGLKNSDLELRDRLVQSGQLGDGYNEEMANLHNKNADMLNKIIDEIGYPTIEKVGKEGSEAAWLVIQHAIGKPDFMKKCVKLLKNAANQDKANPRNLAYLTDRIAVLENKPQLYGTQFDWDEYGQLSPNVYDDPIKVNQRRKSIALNTLEEQTEIMRRQVIKENQLPPNNFEERKAEIEKWKKTVGWIK
jgi:hypothetical protein